MGHFELNYFTHAEALAEAAAQAWLAAGSRPVAAGSAPPAGSVTPPSAAPRLVALSGGRSASRFFEAAARTARDRNRPDLLAETHFFWADERCVPPDHPESNFALARRCLLEPVGIVDHQIHRVRGELPPAEASREAESELRALAPLDGSGQPVLDLVFLGMGEDGHVASLFPGEPEALRGAPAVYRAVVAAKPPPERVTLGYAALRAAREVWVMVSGGGKEAALRDSLSPTGATPLARLIRSRDATRVLVDQGSSSSR